jgi:hypothetical protein
MFQVGFFQSKVGIQKFSKIYVGRLPTGLPDGIFQTKNPNFGKKF